MHAVILAAGTGSRLLPHTTITPKPLLALRDGSTILGRVLHSLASIEACDAVTVVAGHQVDRIERYVADLGSPLPVTVEYNPAYDLGGPLCSLWSAKHVMTAGDFLLLNGDTIVSTEGLRRLVDATRQADGGIFLAVSKGTPEPDDVLVSVTESGEVVAVGKDLSPEHADAISAGLVGVQGSRSREALVDNLATLLRQSSDARRSWPWHSLLNLLVAAGEKVRPVELPREWWREVDAAPDLERASHLT